MISFLYYNDYVPTTKAKLGNLAHQLLLRRVVRTGDQHDNKRWYYTKIAINKLPDAHGEDCECQPFVGKTPPASFSYAVCEECPSNRECKKCDLLRLRPASPLLIHAKMYVLGQKFGIGDLKKLALAKFATTLATKQHRVSDDFIEAIILAYKGERDLTEQLRRIAVNTLAEHNELLEKPAMENLLREYPNLLTMLPSRSSSRQQRSKHDGVGRSGYIACNMGGNSC